MADRSLKSLRERLISQANKKLEVQSLKGEAGKFIVIEGIDGSGKSSLAENLVYILSSEYHAILSHEPGSKIEPDIRALFKSDDLPGPDYMTIMFTADRLMHMRETIRPQLAAGVHVIADRHKLSTLVYQTVSGAKPELVRMAVDIPQPNPDLTIILDLSPEAARVRMTGRKLDSYERDIDRQAIMRQMYLEHRNDFGPSFVIDATQSASEVLAIATRATVRLIEGHRDTY